MPTKLSALQIKRSQEAPFVFHGVVHEVGKNNLRGIPPTSAHALVKVEEVLLAPSNLGDLRGRTLTVVLAKPAKKNKPATGGSESRSLAGESKKWAAREVSGAPASC